MYTPGYVEDTMRALSMGRQSSNMNTFLTLAYVTCKDHMITYSPVQFVTFLKVAWKLKIAKKTTYTLQ